MDAQQDPSTLGASEGPFNARRVEDNSPMWTSQIVLPLRDLRRRTTAACWQHVRLASTRLVHAPLLNWSNRLSNLAPLNNSPGTVSWQIHEELPPSLLTEQILCIDFFQCDTHCDPVKAPQEPWNGLHDTCSLIKLFHQNHLIKRCERFPPYTCSASMPLVLGGRLLVGPVGQMLCTSSTIVIHNRHPQSPPTGGSSVGDSTGR